MKRTFILLIGLAFVLAGTAKVFSQDVKVEVYEKKNVPQRKPVPYPDVREADVMWAKNVWRMIDLREKMNLPLYYPTKPIGNRMNLVSLLLFGIDYEGLKAYDASDDLNEFKMELTKEQLDVSLDAVADTITTTNLETGQLETKVVAGERKTDQIKQILVKEKWYFDRNHSVMKVRIIGICPVRIYNREVNNVVTDEILKAKTFWIYYPDARPLLARHEVYNQNNDAQRISFDDLFWQRRFNSYIYAESNVYNNRAVINYATGIEALYESERIKQYLFEMEHDLWEY
ncbi:MAG: gliding motility protein GldN [Bacteroidota bacterium]